jgi:hypothetical protein
VQHTAQGGREWPGQSKDRNNREKKKKGRNKNAAAVKGSMKTHENGKGQAGRRGGRDVAVHMGPGVPPHTRHRDAAVVRGCTGAVASSRGHGHKKESSKGKTRKKGRKHANHHPHPHPHPHTHTHTHTHIAKGEAEVVGKAGSATCALETAAAAARRLPQRGACVPHRQGVESQSKTKEQNSAARSRKKEGRKTEGKKWGLQSKRVTQKQNDGNETAEPKKEGSWCVPTYIDEGSRDERAGTLPLYRA